MKELQTQTYQAANYFTIRNSFLFNKTRFGNRDTRL